MKPGWFGPKRIGIGASPRSWQGWVVTLVLLAVLAAAIGWARPVIAAAFGLPLPVATGAIVVVWLTVFLGVIALTYDGSKD